ncbi:long-chain-acyl-CoA synthetase [Marinobacter sp. UBA2498]|uniref:long-chain-acyl-CoA synthetase n=1 Tax=Marinobacter sp. UBA2498 TaxID=1946813 RepID=UPI00257DA4DA|nr:long-chain-acyl-CoA synthetase [Marinobacter sp. UBA2498]
MSNDLTIQRTAEAVESPLVINSILESGVRNAPEQEIVYADQRRMSYRDLEERVNRLAGALAECGVKPGDTVAVMDWDTHRYLEAFFAIPMMGAVLHTVNVRLSPEQILYTLNHAEDDVILVNREFLPVLEELKDRIETVKRYVLLDDEGGNLDSQLDIAGEYEALLQQAPAEFDFPELDENTRATTFYTTGTTGLPKAAPGSHRKFIMAYGGFGLMSLAMKPEDVLYCTLPLYHGTALLVCWGSVLAGGSAIALRRKFSASAFWDDVRYYHATTFGYVGELCRYLLNQPPSEQDRNHSLTKMIGNGLRPSIWKEFKQRFGIETVAELYASSEGNIGFSNFFNMDNTVGFSTAPYKLVKFHDGTRDPVRNEKGFMQEVAKGEPGLLIGEITKKWSFEGYTQKEATEKSILRNAFKKGDAWFNTGDVLKEIGCGHLQFVDRMGDTYRWKGENVSTTEVENIIDGSGMVEEAIVYGVEIPGSNGKAGMVTLVPHSNGQEFDVNRLFAYLRDNLPAYAVPVFVRITHAIEKTGTFKYRKVDIQKLGYSLRDGEEVYAWLPGTDGYTLLTPELVSEIDSGSVRF